MSTFDFIEVFIQWDGVFTHPHTLLEDVFHIIYLAYPTQIKCLFKQYIEWY